MIMSSAFRIKSKLRTVRKTRNHRSGIDLPRARGVPLPTAKNIGVKLIEEERRKTKPTMERGKRAREREREKRKKATQDKRPLRVESFYFSLSLGFFLRCAAISVMNEAIEMEA